MRHSRNALRILLIVGMACALPACSAKWAYRQGQQEAKKGNWDMAVARLTKALSKDPDNIGYRIALQNAKVQASQFHLEEARKHLAAEELERAAEELEIASKYDQGNKSIADELTIVRARIAGRDEAKARMTDYEALKDKAKRFPTPILSPRSSAPINMNFPEQGLEKIFDALAKVSGVNILFDPDFRDKKVTVRLSGVSFQEALDQITMAHRLFYKVVDRNTIIIVPEGAAKRRIYDDIFLRTFYIENAELKEVETVVKTALGAQAKVVSNPTLGALNVIGTVDEIALAERVIAGNDKSKGEVMVDVQILEVNRTRMKEFGIGLANYRASASLQPFTNSTSDSLSIRAHLLSSLNLSDWVVNIPNTLLVNFLQTDSNSRILASPRLRAAEGKKTTLKIGTEVPVPVTTFTSAQPNVGVGTFAPATSFQYRNVGVNLELTPKVNANGDILLELAAEFSLLGDDRLVAGTRLPTFLTRNVTGVLRLRDGETSLIGGLLQQQDSESTSGLPGASSIPLIGKFLSNPTKQRTTGEVVISITPHLVRGPKVIEADLTALRLGTKETFRVEGAREPLFGTEPEPSPSPTPPPGLTAPGPEIGRPPGTVSPSMPLPGNQVTPAATPPPPAVFPTPLPPSIPVEQPPVTMPTPVPPPATQPTPFPEDGPPATVPTPSPSPSLSVPPPLVSSGAGANLDGRAGNGARAAQAGAGVSAALSPSSVDAKVGETVPLSLVLMNLEGLETMDVVVAFDPALLDVGEATAGPLLTADGAAVGIDRHTEIGRLHFTMRRPSGTSGSGMVAKLGFRAIAPGPAEVRVEQITLTTAVGPVRPAAPVPVRVMVKR